jgi:glutathione S-transferase
MTPDLTLYAFPTAPGFFNASPFCTKAEILLKMAGLPFTTEATTDYKHFSKGKLPVLRDGDATVEDSEFIRHHLAEKYGAALDDGLTAEAAATGHMAVRTLEERTIMGLVWSRWVEDAGWEQLRHAFFQGDETGEGATMRMNIRAGLTGAGFGRHSDPERRRLIQADIDMLAELLGEREWFLSNKATWLDAAVWAFVANFYASPIRTWLAPMVAAHDNLTGYLDRGMARWYPEGIGLLQQTDAA